MTPTPTFANRYLHWSRSILTSIVWVSACAFGLYIIGFYITELLQGTLSNWNKPIHDIYREGDIGATTGISVHFFMGAVILILGTVQFIPKLRTSFPQVHRVFGWIYVVASVLTAMGGLTFILLRGAMGGTVMNIGFSIYGILMILSAIETTRHARARRIDRHNNWALRLYVLAIGSWLYRMMYGIWGLLAQYKWSSPDLMSGFDYFMDFAFYIPGLMIVELMIRTKQRQTPSSFKIVTASILNATTLLLAAATYFAVAIYWLPHVITALAS